MERMARRVRQSRMMDPRLLRGLLGAGLLCAALAGCGSVVASAPPSAGAAPADTTTAPAAATTAPADTTTASAAAPQVGCASVNQATAVSIRRMVRLLAPVGTNPISTYHQPAQVRALFGQLCAAVTHPAPAQLMHCPADFGTEYVGTFYDGSRVLATFTYASTGCERVSVTAAGKTLATMVYGRAAAAAPHLAIDLNVILGAQPHIMQPQASANPGGANVPA
jgi:hypothetical protein